MYCKTKWKWNSEILRADVWNNEAKSDFPPAASNLIKTAEKHEAHRTSFW